MYFSKWVSYHFCQGMSPKWRWVWMVLFRWVYCWGKGSIVLCYIRAMGPNMSADIHGILSRIHAECHR